MFNVTGGEIVIVLLLALIVLGPDKLPGFIRGAGRLYGEIKKMTSGFSTEFHDAIDDPMREMRETANMAKSWFEEGRSESDVRSEADEVADADDADADDADADDADADDADADDADADDADADDADADDADDADADDADADDADADDADADDDPNFYDDDGVLLDAAAISRMTSEGPPDAKVEADSEIEKPGMAAE